MRLCNCTKVTQVEKPEIKPKQFGLRVCDPRRQRKRGQGGERACWANRKTRMSWWAAVAPLKACPSPSTSGFCTSVSPPHYLVLCCLGSRTSVMSPPPGRQLTVSSVLQVNDRPVPSPGKSSVWRHPSSNWPVGSSEQDGSELRHRAPSTYRSPQVHTHTHARVHTHLHMHTHSCTHLHLRAPPQTSAAPPLGSHEVALCH